MGAGGERGGGSKDLPPLSCSGGFAVPESAAGGYTLRVRVFFSPDYSFPLPQPHPFPMEKYRRVHELLQGDGTLTGIEVTAPDPASEDLLCLAHTRDYVRRLFQGELSPAEVRRLGFPWSPPMVRRARLAASGTVMAAREALRSGMGINLAGGSHHAFAGHGEGYCAINDMAVAVRALRAGGWSGRIALVDCDVHQGNGTAGILAADRGVYTLSIHCESNYPTRKVAGTRDVGLRDGVEDAEYLAVLAAELDRLHQSFRPELVFFQAGVDPLAGDRLGRLRLTRAGLRRRDAQVLRHCRDRAVPLVVVLGGGYAPTLDETADAHADTVRAALTIGRGGEWPPDTRE